MYSGIAREVQRDLGEEKEEHPIMSCYTKETRTGREEKGRRRWNLPPHSELMPSKLSLGLQSLNSR